MLVDTIKHLNQRKAAIVKEIAVLNAEDAKINKVIAAISVLPSQTDPIVEAPAKKKISAATKAKMKKAQQARWAAKETPVAVTPAAPAAPATKPAKKKGKLSAAGLASIKAAQKARWAKINAAKGKTAKKK